MFKKSAQNLKSIKILTLLAVFIAIKIAISSFFIPVGDNLRVYFTFFFVAVEACIVGPIPAMISGVLTDILGFIIHPSGPFFPGYAISNMVASLIYALFLYNTRITITKIVTSKVLVNYLVNVGLGSLWSVLMYSNAYIFYLAKSVVKNTVLLPFEIIALVLIFNMLLPILQKKKFIPLQSSPKIPII